MNETIYGKTCKETLYINNHHASANICNGISLNSTMCFSLSDTIDIVHDNIKIMCYYFQNSTMSKFKFDMHKDYIVNEILQIKLSRNPPKYIYIITDYPKIYKHVISNDIITDCSKIMFNKSYKTTLTNNVIDDVYCILNEMVYVKWSEIQINILSSKSSNLKACSFDKDTALNIIEISYVKIINNLNISSNEKCVNIIDNGNLLLTCMYVFLKYTEITMLNYISDEFDKFNEIYFNKNSFSVVKILLDRYKKIQNINTNCKDSNNLYAKIMSKVNLNTIDSKLLSKFELNKYEIAQLDNKIQDAYDEIEDCVDDLLETDDVGETINCSDMIFRSFMTMMSWIDELDSQGCIGLAMSLSCENRKKKINVSLKSKPNSCLSVLDSFEIMSEHNMFSNISNVTISINPFDRNVLNTVIPLYINETHWTISKHYLQITSGLIKHCCPFVSDKLYWNVYYLTLTSYIELLYKSDNLSESEIILFFSFWKTAIEITKHTKINCSKIFKSKCEQNYKYFDYLCLIGQIFAIDDSSIDIKNMTSTIYYYVKQLSWNLFLENGKNYYQSDTWLQNERHVMLNSIASIVHFFVSMQNNAAQINDIMINMNQNNSIVDDNAIKLIRCIASNINCCEHADYINDFMRCEYNEYDILKEIDQNIQNHCINLENNSTNKFIKCEQKFIKYENDFDDPKRNKRIEFEMDNYNFPQISSFTYKTIKVVKKKQNKSYKSLFNDN